jgi:uncharacterized protein YydD (DUF2326 family)
LRERKLNKELKELDAIIQKVNITKKFAKDAENYQLYKEKYNQVQHTLFELRHIRKQYQMNIDDLKSKMDEIKLINDIQPFYEELIGYFPNELKKNQQDIQNFYNFMVDSRGIYFSHKISEIDYRIEKEQKKLTDLNKVMQRVSKVFRNTDIISDIAEISEEKNVKYEELAQIRVKIDMYQQKTEITANINKIKQDILRQIEMELDEFKNYENVIQEEKELFNTLVSVAYDEIGVFDIELVINTSLTASTGRVKINCTIDDEKSHGRLHMKINMFDLTWLLQGLVYRNTLTFLIHDGSYSKPNGIAKFNLLKFIDKKLKSKKIGQYFVTINMNELDDNEIGELEKEKCIVARLKRTEDNKERFIGFRYTS